MSRALAAPGYTYDLIAEFPLPQTSANGLSPCPGIAINNHDDVAYQTSERAPSQYTENLVKTYLARPGEPPRLIHQGLQWTGAVDPLPAPYPAYAGCFAGGTRPLGINDDGIVAIPVHWIREAGIFDSTNEISVGYILVDPNGTLVREIRDLAGSTGRLNSFLQMAGKPFPVGVDSQLRVSDGISTRDNVVGVTIGTYQPIVNQKGAAATLLTTASGQVELAIADPSDPTGASHITLGPSSGSAWHTDAYQIGFNDLKYSSFASNTNSFETTPPQVVLISPTGQIFRVADTTGGAFTNFSVGRFSPHGTSLNNFNRVLFGASTLPGLGASSNEILIGDTSGNPPTLVLRSDETFSVGGRLFTAACISCDDPYNSLNTNSLNDKGDVAFLTLISELPTPGYPGVQAIRLFVARSDPGIEPGNPILPDPGDELPGGGVRFRKSSWRLAGCVPAGVNIVLCHSYFDPPVATGYDYAMDPGSQTTFASVYVPVPLAGGDGEFVVTYQGFSEPLVAGVPVDFTARVPGGVSSFRITGIDLGEALDPADPRAFVTGLRFLGPDGDNFTFTMKPIVENTDDPDGDGVIASRDNCPTVANPGQEDSDGDGVGEACDRCPGTSPGAAVDAQGCSAVQQDADGDGVPDLADACPGTAPGAPVDASGCSAAQRDSDGDGVVDSADLCPGTAPGSAVDPSGCSAAQRDTDGDGVPDSTDACPGTVPGSPVDASGCAAAQRDSDGDGVADGVDACPGTAPGTPVDASGCPIVSQARTCDADGDGDVDKYDIKAIAKAVGTKATGPTDPRDANHNGRVDLADVLICTFRCDRWLCASP
jgi:hypothetical protein